MFKLFVTVAVLLVMAPWCIADDMEDIKCIVMTKRDAKKDFSSKHLDGDVYFCCKRCKASFDEDATKFATRANYQLVLTGQYEQSGCPCTGGEVDDKFNVKVGEVAVGFCGGDCMNEVKDADDIDAMLELVFSEKRFKKAFRKKEQEIDTSKAKCLMMPENGVKPDLWAKYLDGKVFFCCEDCRNAFDEKKNEEEIMLRANEQLFATGQYEQRLCPFTGAELDDENFVDINGNQVRLCCTDCRDHLKSQPTDDDKAKMVYNEKSFKKSFEKKKD